MPGLMAQARKRARRDEVRRNADARNRWKKAKQEEARKNYQVYLGNELSSLKQIHSLQDDEAYWTKRMGFNMNMETRARAKESRKEIRRTIHVKYAAMAAERRQVEEERNRG